MKMMKNEDVQRMFPKRKGSHEVSQVQDDDDDDDGASFITKTVL